MTKNELVTLAIRLDEESGFPELTTEESWEAKQRLGNYKYSLHTAAFHLWFAASCLPEENT